jgi:hypothetical protein
LNELGEFSQLIPSFRPQDALSGVEHRPASGQKDADRLTNLIGIGGGAEMLGRLIVEWFQLHAGNIGRKFQQHRRGTAAAQEREGSPHKQRHAVGGVDPGGPFCDGRVAARRIEVGSDVAAGRRVTAGQK